MKRTLFGLALACLVTPAVACQVKFLADDDLKELLVKDGTLPIEGARCEALEKNNLVLHISGWHQVMAGANVSWATIQVMDPETFVTSWISVRQTMIQRDNPSQKVADDNFVHIAKLAAEKLPVEDAVAQVLQYRAKAKR